MTEAAAHAPDAAHLLALGAGSIALLLVLILKAKLHPFVALLLVSILLALAAGIPVASLLATIEEGAGKTLGHVALIIPLGAMIGRMIQVSGGAEALATSLVQRFGSRRAPLALCIAGFVIGIPVFFEVGVVMLMPVAYGVAKATARPLLVFALPMCIALLVVHAFLPPHPGPVAAAGLLNAEPGRILLWGLPVCVGAAIVAYLLTRWMTQRAAFVGPDTQDVLAAPAVLGEVEGRLAATNRAAPAPGLPLVIALILLPIVLIMLGSLSRTILPADSPAIGVLATLGIPFVALLIDVLLCAYLLGTRRGWSRSEVSDVLGAAIPGIAIVVLVTGAGGIFAKVLVGSGIGSAIAALLQSTGLPILALAFLITMLLRAAQGPTTVAIIATAGIIEPLVSQAHYGANQLALVCLAMGAGGLSVSHVNDPGFWIVTRLTGMSVSTGLRTWTVVTTCAGVAGFAILGGLWLLM